MMDAASRTNRQVWAEQVTGMLGKVGGVKAELARQLGVSVKTIDRWLDREVDVSEEKVKLAARVFKLDVFDLLVKVGYYSENEVRKPSVDSAWVHINLDAEAVTKVMQSDLPDDIKAELIQELHQQAKADAERRCASVDTLLRIRHA